MRQRPELPHERKRANRAPGRRAPQPSAVEAVVKIIDGCQLGGHYWVFAGGLTNVAVTITVTDTQTGATKVYKNPAKTVFKPVQDTAWY